MPVTRSMWAWVLAPTTMLSMVAGVGAADASRPSKRDLTYEPT